MEKALEILRNENVFDEEYLCFNNIDISSAIEELEEAMNPKTCEGCVYEDKDDGFLKVECVFCLRNSNDNFEPKEQ